MALTPKQEAFALKYVECGIASDAYRHAYDTQKMSMRSIKDEACRVKAHPSVAPAIRELQAQIATQVVEEIVIDRKFLTEGILDTIERTRDKGEDAVTLKGLDMLGKMYDLNEDRLNDRLVTQKDRMALVEGYRQRLINVTPEEDKDEL